MAAAGPLHFTPPLRHVRRPSPSNLPIQPRTRPIFHFARPLFALALAQDYLFPKYGALVSGGVRFFGERLSADFGVGAAFGDDESGCCHPLVNSIYSF